MKKTQSNLLVIILAIIILIGGCEDEVTKEEDDNTPPTVIITQPANDAYITEPLTIKADATDNESVEKVEFLIDGEVIGEDTEVPYEYYWNVVYWADDSTHTISARATDASQNVGFSDTINVVVSLEAMSVPTLISPANGDVISEENQATLIWHSLPYALQYTVELSSSNDFSDTLFYEITVDTTVTITDLTNSNYYWRVKAQNQSGGWSSWSETRQFLINISVGWTFGGSDDDVGKSVQQTIDGGYIIAGYTDSYGAGSRDAWLIKTYANGQEEWSKTFGGSSYDYISEVKQTTDGGYIMTGGRDFGDVWIIKTDASGNEEWDRSFDKDNGFDSGKSIQLTSDGGYIITGFATLWDATTGNYHRDVWLIKTTSSGYKQWDRTFGGNGSETEEGYYVQQTSDGGYVIVGITDVQPGDYYNSDIWLIKTDSYGYIEWDKTFEGTLSLLDWPSYVQQTIDDGYIIVGTTNGGGTSAADPDVWLIKIDTIGNLNWMETFGAAESDGGNFLQHTDDGGYIIVGYTSSYGAGASDVWLIKLDANGNEQWTQTFGGAEGETGYSVEQTSDGGYVIAGFTSSFGAGDRDVWLIKTDAQGNPE